MDCCTSGCRVYESLQIVERVYETLPGTKTLHALSYQIINKNLPPGETLKVYMCVYFNQYDGASSPNMAAVG